MRAFKALKAAADALERISPTDAIAATLHAVGLADGHPAAWPILDGARRRLLAYVAVRDLRSTDVAAIDAVLRDIYARLERLD